MGPQSWQNTDDRKADQERNKALSSGWLMKSPDECHVLHVRQHHGHHLVMTIFMHSCSSLALSWLKT